MSKKSGIVKSQKKYPLAYIRGKKFKRDVFNECVNTLHNKRGMSYKSIAQNLGVSTRHLRRLRSYKPSKEAKRGYSKQVLGKMENLLQKESTTVVYNEQYHYIRPITTKLKKKIEPKRFEKQIFNVEATFNFPDGSIAVIKLNVYGRKGKSITDQDIRTACWSEIRNVYPEVQKIYEIGLSYSIEGYGIERRKWTK